MAGTQVYNVMFQGDAIKTTVTSSGEAVEDWLDEVLSVHRRRLHKLVVGLDVEWRPTFSSAYSRTALLQLCVGRRCLIFQLIHADKVDLGELAAEEMERPDLRHAGLKAIAGAVMGVDMEKPHRVRTGPWDACSLSREQIKYACIDAFVSFEVGRRLLSGDN